MVCLFQLPRRKLSQAKNPKTHFEELHFWLPGAFWLLEGPKALSKPKQIGPIKDRFGIVKDPANGTLFDRTGITASIDLDIKEIYRPTTVC